MSDQPPWPPQQPNQPGGFGPAGQPQPGGFGGPPPGAPGGFGPAGQQPPGGYGGPPPGAPGGYGPAGQQPPGGFGGQPGGFGGPPPGWQGQPQKRSRKGLVIGLVVLLLVVLGVGGVLAWQFLRGGGDSLASRVPEDAVLYVHLNLNPSGSNKLGIRTLIEEVSDAAGEDLLERAASLLEEAGMDAGVDFGEDIDPWLGDQIAIFATDIPVTDPETFETPPPSFGFLIDLDDPTAAAEFIEDEDPLDTWDAGDDREGWLVNGNLDEPDAIVLAIDGGLLYGGTPDAVRDALDVDADEVLTGDERYTEAVAALPDSVLTSWFDAPALVEAASQQSLQMLPAGQEVPVAAAFGISFADGAIDMTTVVINEEGAAEEAGEPVAEVTLGSLPTGGLFYGRAPDVGRLLETLVETADETASSVAEEFDGEPLPAEELPSAQIDMVLDEEFDTSIEEIAGWLGDVAIMAAYDPTESSDNAALLIRAGVGDEEAATDLLDTAVEAAQLAEADGVDVESGLVEVGDARFEVADGAMSMTFGNLSEDTLGDDEVYQAAIDGLPGEPVAYLDVRAIAEAIVAFALPPGSDVDEAQENAVNIAAAFDSLVLTYDVDGDVTRSAMRVAYGSDRDPIELGGEANPPDIDLGPLGSLEDLIDDGGDAVDDMIGGDDPAGPADPVDPGLSPEEELNELDIDLRDAAATMETQFFVDGAYVEPDIEFPVYLPGSSITASVVTPDAYCLVGFTPSGDALVYDSISQDVSEPIGSPDAECEAIVRAQDAPTDTPTTDGEPFAFGDDPALDALYTACEGGDYAACDELFFASPAGSDYELFALTCGNRNDPSADECVTLYGE